MNMKIVQIVQSYIRLSTISWSIKTNCINNTLDHKLVLTWTFVRPMTRFTTLEAVVAITRTA